jgi:hypothetical protein
LANPDEVKNGPRSDGNPNEGLTNTIVEDRMAEQDDSGYPRLTTLKDWPLSSHEARSILMGGEVYITGPEQLDADGKWRFPTYTKPFGYTGLAPWERQDRSPPKLATIYFIGPENGPIKIGYATRLSFRLRDLELANAYPLTVWASVQAAPSLEREYHKRFAAHRLHGEWFTRHDDILAEIAYLNQVAECVA